MESPLKSGLQAVQGVCGTHWVVISPGSENGTWHLE